MEISEIHKTKSVGKLQKSESIAPAKRVEDRLTISSESEKRAAWVEMLKEMPDVRPEKIAAALKSSPSRIELASKILSSFDEF